MLDTTVSVLQHEKGGRVLIQNVLMGNPVSHLDPPYFPSLRIPLSTSSSSCRKSYTHERGSHPGMCTHPQNPSSHTANCHNPQGAVEVGLEFQDKGAALEELITVGIATLC